MAICNKVPNPKKYTVKPASNYINRRYPWILIQMNNLEGDEDIDRLLQRGVRGDERVQGHGIGLAIVQDIVRAYRGELKVERSTELGGARFTVHFPPLF